MFGAYLGGMSANGGKINMGSWDWKDSSTYWGIGIGGALGALGGQMLFGTEGLFAGGTLNVTLSGIFNNLEVSLASISISSSGITLESIGYMTLAGGTSYYVGKSLFNEGNENYPGPWWTGKGKPWEPNIEGPNNNNFIPKGNPNNHDWMKWLVYPAGGWAAGYEFYKNWKGPDFPDVSAPTTTDKIPQIGPKRE